MKKLILTIAFVITSVVSHSQGLEKIIVEKYYVSGAKDTTGYFGHNLVPGSITYRIYVDMLPWYKFQAAFGLPGHELRIETTTRFYNNEDKGGVVANVIPERNLGNNTVMLDSWISAGAAAENYFGILKQDDDTAGTIVNKNGVLQNTDRSAGIPVKIKDGMIPGDPCKVTSFGIDSLVDIFNNKTTGSVFSTTNGSWAALYGASGPTDDNRVLIAQMTTNGAFSFKLNIQIISPEGNVERYVAENPSGAELSAPGLIYPANGNGGSAKGRTGKLTK
jgi:hypothetical protein